MQYVIGDLFKHGAINSDKTHPMAKFRILQAYSTELSIIGSSRQ